MAKLTGEQEAQMLKDYHEVTRKWMNVAVPEDDASREDIVSIHSRVSISILQAMDLMTRLVGCSLSELPIESISPAMISSGDVADAMIAEILPYLAAILATKDVFTQEGKQDAHFQMVSRLIPQIAYAFQKCGVSLKQVNDALCEAALNGYRRAETDG